MVYFNIFLPTVKSSSRANHSLELCISLKAL